MPLTPSTLDDWTYSELVSEGLALLPLFAPEWTNFNASDPGITFLELFAYVTEMLIFQTGQLTPADNTAFFRLLTSQLPDSSQPIDDAIQRALLTMQEPERAVTCEDYELLALKADARVARARCVPSRDLGEKNDAARKASRPGHISVVLIVDPSTSDEDSAQSLARVTAYLEPRRILTTRIHIVLARRVSFEIHLRVAANAGVSSTAALSEARTALLTFFDLLEGGPEGDGWPIGRDVYISDVYLVVSRLGTVDYVTQDVVSQTGAQVPELAVDVSNADRLYRNGTGDLIGLSLAPDELPGKVTLHLVGFSGAEDESRQL